MTRSAAIDAAIKTSEAHGNVVVVVGNFWSKVSEAVHMEHPLDEALRAELKLDQRLKHYTSQATTWDNAMEGFIDESENVAIIFPVGQSSRFPF